MPRRAIKKCLEESIAQTKKSYAKINLQKKLTRMSGPNFNQPIRKTGVRRLLCDKSKRKSNSKPRATGKQRKEADFTVFELQLPSTEEHVPFCDSMETKKFLDSQEDHLGPFLEIVASDIRSLTEADGATTSSMFADVNCSERKLWKDTTKDIENEWDGIRDTVHTYLMTSEAPNGTVFCNFCKKKTNESSLIRCITCCNYLCQSCDAKFHFNFPFHKRSVFVDGCYVILSPNEIVLNEIKSRDVPIPLFPPAVCSNCKKATKLNKVCGNRRLKVITLDGKLHIFDRRVIFHFYSLLYFGHEGRFDLRSAAFQCRSCSDVKECSEQDYLSSGFWPDRAEVLDSSYYFSKEVLHLWYLTKHHTPGTSEMKFLEIIGDISKQQHRDGAINQFMFRQASREYDFYNYTVDKNIKKQSGEDCYGCGEEPLSLHADALMKDYRYEDGSVNTSDSVALLTNSILKSDEAVAQHQDIINSVIKPTGKLDKKLQPATCGTSTYKAARSDSSKFKNLDETALFMESCRHGLILAAINMFAGENYRYVHFMHHQAYLLGAKFLCYDVSCKYWPFAEKVAEKLPEFLPMVEKMTPFLSRMHGKTHIVDCQLKNSGHWKKYAALVSGEEQEQSNGRIYRYANSTKHMGKAARNDHLTYGMIFWNRQKLEKMPCALRKRLHLAIAMAAEYEKELGGHFKEKTEENMMQAAKDLITEFDKSQQGKSRTKTVSVRQLENELEGIQWLVKQLQRRIKTHGDGSKTRNAIRRKISDVKIAGKKLISQLNSQQKTYTISDNIFESGEFPWLPMTEKSFRDRYNEINSWMLWQRCVEEVAQVKKEMVNYLKALLHIRNGLISDISSIESELDVMKTSNNTVSPKSQYLRGKMSMAKAEMKNVTMKVEEAVSMFRDEVNQVPWDGLEDALDIDDEEAMEAVEAEIDGIIESLSMNMPQ